MKAQLVGAVTLWSSLVVSLSGCATLGGGSLEKIEDKMGDRSRSVAELYDRAMVLKTEGQFPAKLYEYRKITEQCVEDSESNLEKAKTHEAKGDFNLADYAKQTYKTSSGLMKPKDILEKCKKLAAFEGLPAEMDGCTSRYVVVLQYGDSSTAMLIPHRPDTRTPSEFDEGSPFPDGKTEDCSLMPKKAPSLPAAYESFAKKLSKGCTPGVFNPLNKGWQHAADDHFNPARPYKYLEGSCWRKVTRTTAEWAK